MSLCDRLLDGLRRRERLVLPAIHRNESEGTSNGYWSGSLGNVTSIGPTICCGNAVQSSPMPTRRCAAHERPARKNVSHSPMRCPRRSEAGLIGLLIRTAGRHRCGHGESNHRRVARRNPGTVGIGSRRRSPGHRAVIRVEPAPATAEGPQRPIGDNAGVLLVCAVDRGSLFEHRGLDNLGVEGRCMDVKQTPEFFWIVSSGTLEIAVDGDHW